MKKRLRQICSPLLDLLERGQEPYTYRASHRAISVAVGTLFLVLSLALVFVGVSLGQLGFVIPGTVFFFIALVAYIVAFLGSDRAVAKLWGNR